MKHDKSFDEWEDQGETVPCIHPHYSSQLLYNSSPGSLFVPCDPWKFFVVRQKTRRAIVYAFQPTKKKSTQCTVQVEQRYKSKYKKVGVLPIRIVQSNVSSVGPSSERNNSLTKGQRSKRQTILSVLAVYTNFFIFRFIKKIALLNYNRSSSLFSLIQVVQSRWPR